MFLGVLQEHKYENCMTLDKKSWGYRANARLEDFLTASELIQGKLCLCLCHQSALQRDAGGNTFFCSQVFC